jgi:hypothetical protein
MLTLSVGEKIIKSILWIENEKYEILNWEKTIQVVTHKLDFSHQSFTFTRPSHTTGRRLIRDTDYVNLLANLGVTI